VACSVFDLDDLSVDPSGGSHAEVAVLEGGGGRLSE